MAITKEEFNKAFRLAVAEEFKDIPLNEDEIDYTFSKKFEKKMQKLIRAEKRPYWRFVNTAYKKVIVAAVIITILFASAMSVSAVREKIINFVIEVYKTYIHLDVEGQKTSEITYEYKFNPIPDGFYETDVVRYSNEIVRTYENNNGNMIELDQDTTMYVDLSIDNEHGTLKEITVKNFTVHLYETNENGGFSAAQWLTEDNYLLSIYYYGNISTEEMIALIESIE